jgi:hypothetical protein
MIVKVVYTVTYRLDNIRNQFLVLPLYNLKHRRRKGIILKLKMRYNMFNITIVWDCL